MAFIDHRCISKEWGLSNLLKKSFLNIFYESNQISHPEWMAYFKYKSKNRSIKAIGQAHLSVPTSEQPSWTLFISPYFIHHKDPQGCRTNEKVYPWIQSAESILYCHTNKRGGATQMQTLMAELMHLDDLFTVKRPADGEVGEYQNRVNSPFQENKSKQLRQEIQSPESSQ